MRKYIAMILVALLCFSFCGFTYETIDETTERIEYLQTRQYHANSMANSARELGYDDESLIITEAKMYGIVLMMKFSVYKMKSNKCIYITLVMKK